VTVSVRRPPRPPFETTLGVCSMCGGPLPGRRRSWCSDACVDIWNVATRQPDALAHLVGLHGHRCWGCGADWEVREREPYELFGYVYEYPRDHAGRGPHCRIEMPPHGPPSPRPVRLDVDHIRPLWSARRLGIVEIRDLIAGIEQRAEPVALLVALPAARHALARLERADQEDTDG
jgi:hypothetical protein